MLSAPAAALAASSANAALYRCPVGRVNIQADELCEMIEGEGYGTCLDVLNTADESLADDTVV